MRIPAVASAWIGSPFELISIVTTPARELPPSGLTDGHLADVDAGDPDRRGDVQLGLGREHRLEHERRAAERRRPAEHQVDRGRDHERGDDPGDEVRDPRALAPRLLARRLPLVVASCRSRSGWSARSGDLGCRGRCRSSAAAPEYGSLPAAHSAGSAGRVGVRVRVDVQRPVLDRRIGLRRRVRTVRRHRLAAEDVVDRDQREPQRRARVVFSDSKLAMLRRNSVT